MKNREYYKDQIYEVACRHDRFAINKTTKKIGGCLELSCSDCLFNPGGCDCYERALKWLEQEHVEPILNGKEKQYLENFIRPFKDRVKSIAKWRHLDIYAYLQLRIISLPHFSSEDEIINLPLFVRNEMYQHMTDEKEYTLKELKLFKNEGEDDEE